MKLTLIRVLAFLALTFPSLAGPLDYIYTREPAGVGARTEVVVADGNNLIFGTNATGVATTYVQSGTGSVLMGTSPTIATPIITGAIAFPDGARQTFNPNVTTPGFNVGSQAGDPSTPSNGDIWYDSTGNLLRARINGVTVSLAAGGGSGDVTAAANFGTDNRLIRSDGTTKGVQASGITVDDSDNITGVNNATAATVDTTNFQIGGVPITSTAAELNFVDGVTSAIQTQLNAKAPLPVNLTDIAAAAMSFGGNNAADDLKLVRYNAEGDLIMSAFWTVKASGNSEIFQFDLPDTPAASRLINFIDAAGDVLLHSAAQTITNKQLTTPSITEVAAPAAAAAGTVNLYAKADGLLYGKDDAGVETQVSNAAGGGNGYTMQFSCARSGLSVDGATLFLGRNFTDTLFTSYNPTRIPVPKTGTVKAYFIEVNISGTLATAEDVVHSLRLNNTSDISSVSLDYDAADRSGSSTGLSQAVTEGTDYLVLKIVCPSWATNPTNVQVHCVVYIE